MNQYYRMEKYPREMWSTATLLNRPGLKACKRCAVKFDKGERFVVVDRQVNWFRGDDEVEAFHGQCAPARAHKHVKIKRG